MQFLSLYGGRLRAAVLETLLTCTLSSASGDSRFRSSAQVSTFAAEKFISHHFCLFWSHWNHKCHKPHHRPNICLNYEFYCEGFPSDQLLLQTDVGGMRDGQKLIICGFNCFGLSWQDSEIGRVPHDFMHMFDMRGGYEGYGGLKFTSTHCDLLNEFFIRAD